MFPAVHVDEQIGHPISAKARLQAPGAEAQSRPGSSLTAAGGAEGAVNWVVVRPTGGSQHPRSNIPNHAVWRCATLGPLFCVVWCPRGTIVSF